MSERKRFCPP